MSTSTVAAPATRRSAWRIAFRALMLLVLLAFLVLVAAGIWFYRVTHSSLAQLDGSIAVAGLKAPVTVIRDAQGVPHLTAAGLEDLFFAQGYVTAQDRLWQMDMTRRAAAGEMAEILPASSAPAPAPSRSTAVVRKNPSWVEYDKRQRTVRLRAVSERVAAQLSPRDRTFFEAYARGVNTYIEQHRDNLPVEFRILRYSPRPWTPADSVLVGIAMSQLLNPQYETEYWRGKIAEHLAPQLMADLYPVSSPSDHAPGDDKQIASAPKEPAKSSQFSLPKNSLLSAVLASQTFDDCAECVPGSNNWVVSGAHTVTGKAMLSNDMHLPHRVPGVWYELQLHSGDFNVEGFSLPGIPMITVGHNQRIAWGFTNLNPDVQDLFVENFNDNGEYQTPTGWQKPEIAHEVIHVKGQPDVTVDVVITRHGPIISDFFPGETRKIALGWMIYDSRNISIPLFDLDSAQNWEQFRKALSTFSTPSQNVVYGDVDGNIGYQAMGFAPIRASGDGTLPVSGADGKHDWTGYLPFDHMPMVYNPPSGIIATANSRTAPNGYPYLLATQWFPPYRVERIYQVLESGKKLSAADMLSLQTDITSDYDRFFAERFVSAVDHSSKATNRAHQAADVMRGFDGRMLADSVAPTIEVNARKELWALLLEPKLGADWEHYEWSEAAVALETIVRGRPARWLPAGVDNFDDLLAAAVDKAVRNAPPDLKTWQYGATFPVEINHPLFGGIPVVRGWAGPGRQAQAGGSYTVKQVGRTFGPSERMTVDFSDLDASTFNIVIGESGQIFSPYYKDQWPAWYGNTTFTLAYSDAAIERTKTHELTLEPSH
ncbi:MAG TPA: penicillin acylase family protein [Candidatus Angelobacter sp.]|nr:penicillin acylase family protein [Candidatus Angelobacter sp.]